VALPQSATSFVWPVTIMVDYQCQTIINQHAARSLTQAGSYNCYFFTCQKRVP
jgi:phage I-like protein